MATNTNIQSSIVPQGNSLQNVRNDQFTVNSLSLEIFHILCFFVVAYFIFGKDLISKNKKAKKVAPPQIKPVEQMEQVEEAEFFYKKAQ